MAFLLAALFTLYRSISEKKKQSEGFQEDHAPQDTTITAQTLFHQGSTLYQTAVVSCTVPSVSEATTRTLPDKRDRTQESIQMIMTTTEAAPATATTTTTTETIPEATRTSRSRSSSGSSQSAPEEDISSIPDVFLATVKAEWIDGVFGKAFCRTTPDSASGSSDSSNTEKGICGTSFQTMTVNIPAAQQQYASPSKVGVTVSRMPIGVYVRSVSMEAACAGVKPLSVLVSINNLTVLAEPSKQCLERLWQYEGVFEQQQLDMDSILIDNNHEEEESYRLQGPAVLKFLLHGKLYSVIMLSNPPWGIQWAPAANMPLVKRISGIAQDSGVKRGSLVAAVNECNFRSMDHMETAVRIRDLYEKREAIHLTLVFPPAETRASHYEKLSSARQVPSSVSPRKVKQTIDGIEIKFLPLGFAIGSLCHSDRNVVSDTVELSMEEFSEAVAAGKMEAPKWTCKTPSMPRKTIHKYNPCPSLPQDNLMEDWDPLQSLVYCLCFQSCSFDESELVKCIDHTTCPIRRLHELTSSRIAVDITSSFLLQFISLICVPGSNGSMRKSANELTTMLLKLSRRNEVFCQRLYFLLRSYISTFETSGPVIGSDGDPRNLMALLNCLEMLRFAEKELSGRSIGVKSAYSSCPGTVNTSSEQRHPFRPKSSSETTLGRIGSNILESRIRGVIASVDDPSLVPSPIATTPESFIHKDSPVSDSSTPKKRGVFTWKNASPTKSAHRRARGKKHEQLLMASKQSDEQEQSRDMSLTQTPSSMYESMSDFLTELDKICIAIESTLRKSFRQKIADWALQPWSAGKDAALAEVTAEMRNSLKDSDSREILLVNPVEPSELLSSVVYNECYILPSSSFPILLTFNVSEQRCSDSIVGEEKLYRTKIELLSITGPHASEYNSFSMYCAVAGIIAESGDSTQESQSSALHTWKQDGVLTFDTHSSIGAPQSVSIRLKGNSENFDKRGQFHSEAGFCWLDISGQWQSNQYTETIRRIKTSIWPNELAACRFDEHGDLPEEAVRQIGNIQLEVSVTTQIVETNDESPRKRMLLYKHDDDLRQEAFSVQFIKTCDDILRASGLDMKLLTFQCTPVGTRRGFIEWVPGSVALSEIGHSFGSVQSKQSDDDATLVKSGLSKFASLRRLGGQQNESIRRIAGGTAAGARGSIANDPVQDYLRSVAFDPDAPYLIQRRAMDTYVKSCAGFCVITYILGVGDRHLDNLLLHQSGAFFHCDFSFILGSDPKKVKIPMRITEEMVYGMGGKESDNYSKFLSLVGAAFLALRRPENVRVLLSMVRLMDSSCLPDISENQSVEQAILDMRDRLRLNLSETRAIAYIEDVVEQSLSNKIWIAVDAIHNLGKKF